MRRALACFIGVSWMLPAVAQEQLSGPPAEVRMWDCPFMPGDEATDTRLIYTGHWSTYLMWVSKRNGSIPVTRWKLTWTFNATADAFAVGSTGWTVDPTSIGRLDTTTESKEMPWWAAGADAVDLINEPMIRRQ